MNKSEYSQKLRDPKWIEKREAIKQRDKHTCRFCGETERPLQVHHLKYDGDPWEAPDAYLVTLCDWCHEEETFYRPYLENKILTHFREAGFSCIELARLGAMLNRITTHNIDEKLQGISKILESANNVKTLHLNTTI